VLARDPYGIKPLYVARTDAGVLFASQVKALLASGCVSRTPDPAGLAGFHIWGSVPEPFTLYEDIKPLAPGSVLVLDADGGTQTHVFADVGASWNGPAGSAADLREIVHDALASSVRAHLVADVPVAVLLSGGVDSGAVAALAWEAGQSTEGVTLRFPEFEGMNLDETPRARAIAGAYGLRHTVRDVTRDEFLGDLPAILEAMDQPSIDGVNTWFATKGIAERGYKVALSGVGGDELFCGYNTFRSAPKLHRLARRLAAVGPLEPAISAGLGVMARVSKRPKLAGLTRFGRSLEGAYMLWRGLRTPGELAAVMPADAAREGLRRLAEAETSRVEARGPIAAMAALESTRYLRNQLLRDSDWASMAHSIELRTPLVDWTLLTALAPYAEQFMDGRGKALMATAPARALPTAILEHRKTGFGLPMGEWLAAARVTAGAAPQDSRAPWARHWSLTVSEAFGISR
jgi:asparagine synthase (glutamine-hydrolysing)